MTQSITINIHPIPPFPTKDQEEVVTLPLPKLGEATANILWINEESQIESRHTI